LKKTSEKKEKRIIKKDFEKKFGTEKEVSGSIFWGFEKTIEKKFGRSSLRK
jgi:hypothetical protein